MDNIGDNRIAGRVFQTQRRGFTIFHTLALICLFAISLNTAKAVARRFGPLAGIAAGILSAVVYVKAVNAFHRWGVRRMRRELCELSEKYPLVYRVIALPTDASSILKAEGAEIEVGDYGWEAEPIHSDGLIYLHGLTEKWRVVWYAGFSPDQIEKVGPKPRSQYDLPYSWICVGSNAPPCPYPVQSRETNDLNYPTRIIGRFVQGKRMT